MYLLLTHIMLYVQQIVPKVHSIHCFIYKIMKTSDHSSCHGSPLDLTEINITEQLYF